MRSFHIVRSLSDTGQRYLVGRLDVFFLSGAGDAEWSFGDAEFIFMFTPKMRLKIRSTFSRSSLSCMS